jgi:formylmethanofuran dehydrogenase subunit C
MLFKSFQSLNSPFALTENAFNRVQRFAGDMAEIGRGEILVKL